MGITLYQRVQILGAQYQTATPWPGESACITMLSNVSTALDGIANFTADKLIYWANGPTGIIDIVNPKVSGDWSLVNLTDINTALNGATDFTYTSTHFLTAYNDETAIT